MLFTQNASFRKHLVTNACGFSPRRQAGLRHRLAVPQLHSVLTLWLETGSDQIPQGKGSAPQHCPAPRRCHSQAVGSQVAHSLSPHTHRGSRPWHLLLTLDLHCSALPGPFPCDICGRQFNDTGNLKRHIECTHGGKRKWTCFICGKSVRER